MIEYKKLEELEEYAYLDGAELGEYIIAMLAMYQRQECMSEPMLAIVELEIEEQLKWYKENTYIHYDEKTRIVEDTWLEYKDV